MPETKGSLLIADDDSFIRILLSRLFTEEGYRVRSSADSFSALTEIHRRLPEFLISDLNMSGTSGFELLAIIRSQFPEIQVIAMSNAPSGNDISRGVAADGFFHKRGGFGVLLRIVRSLPRPERMTQQTHAAPSPIWVSKHLRNRDGRSYVAINVQNAGGAFQRFSKARLPRLAKPTVSIAVVLFATQSSSPTISRRSTHSCHPFRAGMTLPHQRFNSSKTRIVKLALFKRRESGLPTQGKTELVGLLRVQVWIVYETGSDLIAAC